MYRVAVIDDVIEVNNELTRFVQTVLKDVRVDQFYDRDVAEQAIKRIPYDLITVDIEMNDEEEAGLGIIHTNALHQKLPVIIVTGNEVDRYARMAKQFQAYDFVAKPLEDGSTFMTAVRHAIRKVNQDKPKITTKLEEDRYSRTVYWEGKKLNIAPVPLGILRYLVDNPSRVVPYEEIWEECLEPGTRNTQYVRKNVDRIKVAISDACPGEEKKFVCVPMTGLLYTP